MSDAPFPPYSNARHDDEIAISELLLRLWLKRGLMVMLPLTLAGLTLIGILIGKTASQSEVSFYIELNGIAFSDAARNGDSDSDSDSDKKVTTRYPNGTIFSPQDLVSPTVIKALSEQTALDADKLFENIDVQFGTPLSNGVLEEYDAALASAKGKASTQDLLELNERYERRVNAASKRGLKISVNFVGLGVTESTGMHIAQLLPRIWTSIYTEQFAIYLSPDVASLRWTQNKLDITSAIGLQEADIQLANLKRGAEVLSNDGRLSGIKTNNGASPADLLGYIDDFRAIFFDPLFISAFGKNETLTRVYTQDLRFEIEELDIEIQELNQRLNDIRGFQTRAQNTENADASSQTQLDGTALAAVVNLAEQAALSSYLEDSLNQRYQLITERARLVTRLERISGDEAVGQIGSDFIKVAKIRYQAITNDYEEILTNAQSFLTALTPVLFSVTTQPDTVKVTVATRDVLLMAIAIVVGLLVAMIWALVLVKPGANRKDD